VNDDYKVIDAHVHLGHGREKTLDTDQLLALMDRYGVDRAVVCPVDSEIILHNRAGNDRILDAVRAHPDRLVGFAVANPWYGEQAVAELKRAFGEGLRGLKLKSSIQGFRLSDEWIEPVVAVAAEAGFPVYCHTGTANFAMPFQLAELARRFPETHFIMGHGGASDYWYDVRPVMALEANVYLEISKVPPSGVFGVLNARPAWASRILFGSNLPAASYSAELRKIPSVTDDPAVRAAIMGGNMAHLLGEAAA
jgi:predicted TIM-barrel fold metal-dependent hydrolase